MSFELTTDVLRYAYSQGYFPMPSVDQHEILWYHPNPRAVIPLDKFKVSRSLWRSLRNRGYRVSYNEAFVEVMKGCADRDDTWINEEFIQLYSQLHEEGDAHSVEVWDDGTLVGGLYGVSFGGAFFAESKFHRARDASKVALYHLIEHMKSKQMTLLEVQFMTEHLGRLGAKEIESSEYIQQLGMALEMNVKFIG